LAFRLTTHAALVSLGGIFGDAGAKSLFVDEIGDVVEVQEEAFKHPPETLRGTARALILGASKLKDRLLLMLDTDKGGPVSEEPPVTRTVVNTSIS